MALASQGLPANGETIDDFPVPDPPFMQETHSTTTGSNLDVVQTGSVPNSIDINPSGSLNPLDPFSDSATQDEKGVPFEGDDARDDTIRKRSKRNNNYRLWLVASSALFLVLLAIVLGVYFGVTRHHKVNSSASGSHGPPASPSPSAGSGDLPGSNSTITYGGDGTVVTTDQGTNFTYSNKFGGYFVVDLDDPFNNNARAQSWSPPLNQSWVWGTDQVLG
jgi:glucan 1,3-beta-glucosidase